MKNKVDKSNKVSLKYVIWMQIGAVIFSVSNIFSKFASKEPFLSWKFILLYGGSLAVMFVYALLWQQILKFVPLITAYSNRLVSMIWGVVWGALIFNEHISIQMIIGTLVIMLGLYITVKADE